MDRIGSEIERELARSGAQPVLPLAAITAVWPHAVGAAVAQQAWPLRVSRDGTLHVATSSATWAFELDRLSADILGALSSRLSQDAPKKLRFAVGPIPEPAAAESMPPASAPLEPTSEEVTAAASAAAEIDDPELRELAARAVRASLAKARSGRRF